MCSWGEDIEDNKRQEGGAQRGDGADALPRLLRRRVIQSSE